jgi:hypothetical protein
MQISQLTLIKAMGAMRSRLVYDVEFAIQFPECSSSASRRNLIRDTLAVAELEQAVGLPVEKSFSV